ncbi:MAG TPA: uroporphyrinogen-III C-methyltransferase [Polyangiaceae bacterium]|nr:uroporphyrinogen-III C-methyltransferase [Polyangiaceae bacterium]
MVGKVYLIGAGPGDPGLLTLRGARLLGKADVVLYDALAHPALLEHARPGAELRHVGKRYGEESFSQDAINAEIVALAKAGRIVARLKGGDPLLFARGAEEIEALANAAIPFEIVPGITSPIGAAAYAGISLTHRDLSSSVAFITGTESPGKERTAHDWSKLATATQTLCVIMGMKRLPEITAALLAHGRDPKTPAVAVQWGTWARQAVLEATVSDIAERAQAANITNPSVVVIGEVASLRRRMRWFDQKPLFGKRIVVTRPRHQANETAREIRERGAEAVLLPAIEIAPPPDEAAFESALDRLGDYALVAFTSANGAERTMAALAGRRHDARAFGRALVAAIGPGTESALAKRGIVADVVATEYRGEGLAEAIVHALARRMAQGPVKALVLRALVARDALPATLASAGIEVDVVAAYETRPAPAEGVAKLAADLEAGKIDVVTFTSSSTVRELASALGPRACELLTRAVVAVIGPVTQGTAQELGLRVDVAAAEYTVTGMLDALERHYSGAASP